MLEKSCPEYMIILLKIFGKLQEHYNYLQITKYVQRQLKCPNIAQLHLGFSSMTLSIKGL